MKKISVLFVFVIIIFQSCQQEDELEETPVINALDLNTEIRENPLADEVIGTIPATTTLGVVTFELVSQNPENAMTVDPSNGTLTVNDPSIFDFETNPVIEAVYAASVGEVVRQGAIKINLIDGPDYDIWRGENIEFVKDNGADPSLSENQDRITDDVWITRGNDGGQIFNIFSESQADKSSSPEGTEWAFGLVEEIEGLDFKPFREAVGRPNTVVGKELVLHLIEQDIYMNVKFTSWSQGKLGGFTYERPGSPE